MKYKLLRRNDLDTNKTQLLFNPLKFQNAKVFSENDDNSRI